MAGSGTAGGPTKHSRARSARQRAVLGLNVILWGIVLAAGAWWVIRGLPSREQTERAAPRFDPPVLAGQNVTGACSGGFYARDGQTIVLTLSAHCASPSAMLRDGDGRLIGLLGPIAQLSECPDGRICAPSDFLALALAPDRIPWGHLDLVDMGAGGYRKLGPDTPPLACEDVKLGDRVEMNGRERYRTGQVVEIGRYEHERDTIFPCMVVVDIEVGIGDSGGAVLVNGLPAGVVSRGFVGHMGFTPLAEGLANLGLSLCTSPDCDLSPETVEQPTE